MIDFNNLDGYVRDGISFSGRDILNWCVKNKKSDDFNNKYIAKEILSNYFNSNKSINLDKYYYILYNNIFISNKLFRLRKDQVLSPKYDNTVSANEICKMCRKINTIYNHIKSKCENEDDNIRLEKIMNILNTRLKKIGTKYKISSIKNAYNNVSHYKKCQIYSILKHSLCELETEEYMYNYIETK